MSEKIIYLERKIAIHSLYNHRIRAWFYKKLLEHYERNSE